MPLNLTAQRPLWHPAEWPSWCGIALVFLWGRLPYRLNAWLGRVMGWLLAPLLIARGRVAQINLRLCFPEKSAAERAALLRANLRNSGSLLSEFAFAWMASKASSARVPVRFDGLEVLQAAHARGKGILLVGAHFSHLELAGRLFAERVCPAPLAGMYREHKTAAMEFIVKRQRLKYAQAMFRRDELRAAVRWLKQGSILWYAPDQEYRRGDVVFAPFFGIPASTLTATHQLAKMTGAAVVGFAHRRTEAGFTISFHAPDSAIPSNDVIADTAAVNRLIEAAIRAAPEQYLWLHQRFKSQPEGAQSPYGR
jgi:Kdo2-lipid IVA lauroyltransferase/acyltransferase